MESYQAHLQMFDNVAGVLRIFEPGKKFGDPYCWSATAHNLGENTIELLGVTHAPTLSQIRAIHKCLFEAGYENLKWDRIKDGKIHTVNLKIRKI